MGGDTGAQFIEIGNVQMFEIGAKTKDDCTGWGEDRGPLDKDNIILDTKMIKLED